MVVTTKGVIGHTPALRSAIVCGSSEGTVINGIYLFCVSIPFAIGNSVCGCYNIIMCIVTLLINCLCSSQGSKDGNIIVRCVVTFIEAKSLGLSIGYGSIQSSIVFNCSGSLLSRYQVTNLGVLHVLKAQPAYVIAIGTCEDSIQCTILHEALSLKSSKIELRFTNLTTSTNVNFTTIVHL